jgi:hypothetical protein
MPGDTEFYKAVVRYLLVWCQPALRVNPASSPG